MPIKPSGSPLSLNEVNTELRKSATATVSLNDSDIRILAGIVGSGVQISMSDFYGKSYFIPTQLAVFGLGSHQLSPSGILAYVIVASNGVVGNDNTIAGDYYRTYCSACTYGDGLGIFNASIANQYPSAVNYVSATGIVAFRTYVPAGGIFGQPPRGTNGTAGTFEPNPSACSAGYGADKGVMVGPLSVYPQFLGTSVVYISNTGTYSADNYIANTSDMYGGSALRFGQDKAIVMFGRDSGYNYLYYYQHVSNIGVFTRYDSHPASLRTFSTGSTYGGDKAVCVYGMFPNSAIRLAKSNLISNTGVIASDTACAGTPVYGHGGCAYGGDKGIIGYGYGTGSTITNLITNTGVVGDNRYGAGRRMQEGAAVSVGN